MQKVWRVTVEFETALFIARRDFILASESDVEFLRVLPSAKIVRFSVDHVLSAIEAISEIEHERKEHARIGG